MLCYSYFVSLYGQTIVLLFFWGSPSRSFIYSFYVNVANLHLAKFLWKFYLFSGYGSIDIVLILNMNC